MVYQQTKLRKWIDINKIKWFEISANINAIDLLKNHPKKINWSILSSN
jgi:hypothetical protein